MEVVIRKTIFGWIVVLQSEEKTMAPPFDSRDDAVRYCNDNGLKIANQGAK